jgi:valyl-tRNA synthetase
MIKPSQEIGMDEVTYNKTIEFFETLIKLAHPFMPFLTEEIWHTLRERIEDDYCIVSEYPEPQKADMETIRNTDKIIETISSIRNYRSEIGMSPKNPLDLYIKSANSMLYRQWEPIIRKMANINTLNFVNAPLQDAKSFVIKQDEFYIPQEKNMDKGAERAKLMQELEYTKGFLNSVVAKLSNERFVQNARPEVIENERQKKEDAETKIRTLEESLGRLN